MGGYLDKVGSDLNLWLMHANAFVRALVRNSRLSRDLVGTIVPCDST
jgi:hypothetical protein